MRLSEQAAAERADVRPISPAVATAIVAGINELMLEAVEEGRAERLTEVVDARLRDHLRGGGHAAAAAA